MSEEPLIHPDKPPFIIAELSGNHNGSLARALQIVDEAAKAGADAIKLQTYTADTITLDCAKPDFVISDEKSLWNGRGLYSLYKEAYTPWEWHREIFNRARGHGMVPLSTPFDETAVDFLETLDSQLYKIASFELTHLPLIEKVARTGKSIVMSCGMATEDEISLALKTARDAGARDITLLKCTSQYPAEAKDANLLTMPDMARKFGVKVGLSDHTLGLGVALAAVAYGAVVIEKHLTLCRADGGVDSAFSLEPHELHALKVESIRAWNALGEVLYGGAKSEYGSKRFRQSIWPKRPIKAGETLSSKNLKICRPGYSLSPKHWLDVHGKKAVRDLDMGERLLPGDAV